MANAKKQNIKSIFLFLFLILFPFGQIIRIGIIHSIDIIAGIAAVYILSKKIKKPAWFGFLEAFLLIALFTWILGSLQFYRKEVFWGLMYLIRLAAYVYFILYAVTFARDNKIKTLLSGSLIAVSVASALFGWVQYFTYPSIRPFLVWGWDEHLFRLVGTFLDPTFLGLIIVFGLLAALNAFLEKRKKIFLFSSVFLLFSLAFTYSRASYLAFIVGIIALGVVRKKTKEVAALLLGLTLLIFLLPTSGNTILRVTREFSAIARIDNYSEAIAIYKTSPLFGVGYNNLCLAKEETTGNLNLTSHACSGSDSSILFLLATTGTVGLIVFSQAIYFASKAIDRKKVAFILPSALALFTHSIFSNSLVYPWVMGYFALLVATSLRREV